MFQYQKDKEEHFLPEVMQYDNMKAFNPSRAKKQSKVNSQNRQVYELNHLLKYNTIKPSPENEF